MAIKAIIMSEAHARPIIVNGLYNIDEAEMNLEEAKELYFELKEAIESLEWLRDQRRIETRETIYECRGE